MTITDEATLDEFRHLRLCEWCGAKVRGCEPAHIFARGRDNGFRLDVRINLVGLCSLCHRRQHDGGTPSPVDLLRRAAVREATTPAAIRAVVWWLRRLDKDASVERIEQALEELDEEASRVARLTLLGAGKLEVPF